MSEAILLSWAFTIPALIIIFNMVRALWRKPRWGAYLGGAALLVVAFVVCFGFTSFMYQTGGPLVLALMSFGGWLMMMIGAYVIVGLIVVLMRRGRAA